MTRDEEVRGADRGEVPMDEIDVRFAAWLKRVAADYHLPPETPREALWARVEAGWRAASAAEMSAEVLAQATEADGSPPVTWMAEGPLEGLPGEAADYHLPPETPREEMWPRIEAAWRLRSRLPAGAREAGLEPAGAGTPARGTRGRRSPRRAPWAWAVGLAATLVLGIAIGRQSVSELERQGASPIATATRVEGETGRSAGAPGDAPAATGERDPAGEGVGGAPGREPAPGEGPGGGGEPTPAGGGAEEGPMPAGGAPEAGGRSGPALADGGHGAGEAGVAYRAAAVDHFGRTEAFLTSFRSGESAESAVASRWARELLLDTRLLMDWAGNDDPRLAMLLGELELVLAQIAGLGNDGAAGEREMIVDGMETRDVLPRLRSAIPAGPAGTYLQGA